MRMLLGIWLRIRDTAALEQPVTSVTAMAITKDVSSLTVTASALHRPSTCNVIGLVLSSGSNRIFFGDGSPIRMPPQAGRPASRIELTLGN